MDVQYTISKQPSINLNLESPQRRRPQQQQENEEEFPILQLSKQNISSLSDININTQNQIPAQSQTKLNTNPNVFCEDFYRENLLDQPFPLQEDIPKKLGHEHFCDLIYQEQKIDKKVLIICLGGTISMVPGPKGLEVKKGAIQQLIQQYHPLFDKDYVDKNGRNKKTGEIEWYITPRSIYHKRTWYKFLEIDEPIDSSNINTNLYHYIAELIESNYSQYDGFILTHGTDTMSYTASALSFLLQNLQKTVILTGSMIPLSEKENDAANNLTCSLLIVGHFTIPQVCIMMNDRLIRGNRAKKCYSQGIDAFDSPMYPQLILFTEYQQEKLIVNREAIKSCEYGNNKKLPLKVHKNLQDNVCILTIYPSLNMDVVKYVCTSPKIEGIIIQSYGAGNIPSKNKHFLELIKNAVKRGVIVVNISQCYHSEVTPVYEAGVTLKELGVVFGYDMTLESALSKLQYLLSKKQYLKKDQIKILMRTSIRGELTLPKEKLITAEQEQAHAKIQSRPYRLYIDEDSNLIDLLKQMEIME